MLFFLLNNKILNCFSSLITACFHKTTISFLIKLLCDSRPPQSYILKQTNKQPVAQLCSQPTVLPNNLQNNQNQTASHFPPSPVTFGANLPNFVDSQTQSNAIQNQFCHPNNGPNNLTVNNSQASASNANFDPVPQSTNLD